MKRAIIIGASSGMGKEVSQLLLAEGWHIGIGARRTEALEELRTKEPDAVVTATIDVMSEDAPQRLEQLIADNGGMDLFFLASGIGKQNPHLEGLGHGSLLLCHQGFSEHLYRSLAATGSHASSRHLLYRYPTRLCQDRFAERRQELSAFNE